jgi:hypothetical protein
LVVNFQEDGQGRVATDRATLRGPFDPDDPETGYLLEYWFEGPVLYLRQLSEGNLMQGIGCNPDKAEVGQYIADIVDADEMRIRFWMLDDRCSGRVYGFTNNWWQYLEP